jgi:hypothetical protein
MKYYLKLLIDHAQAFLHNNIPNGDNSLAPWGRSQRKYFIIVRVLRCPFHVTGLEVVEPTDTTGGAFASSATNPRPSEQSNMQGVDRDFFVAARTCRQGIFLL